MTFILEKLYLGSRDDAHMTEHLRHKLGITHILTIDNKPLKMDVKEGFTYKLVTALDIDSSDLLRHMEDSILFINEGRSAGGILVHCAAGRSRSATIVLAYIMQTLSLTLEDALKLVKCQRPEISPNDGFTFQLKLFETMGNRVDNTHTEYKAFKLERLAYNIVQRGYSLASLPDDAMEVDPGQQSDAEKIMYRCRKCRRCLFLRDSVMGHIQGDGKRTFNRFYHYGPAKKEEDVTCTQSLFTEPILWMKEQILTVEGKIFCPKCQAKLGSFNWGGQLCACGEWVIPGFHFSNGKVDEIKPRVLPPGASPRVLLPGASPRVLPPVVTSQSAGSTSQSEAVS